MLYKYIFILMYSVFSDIIFFLLGGLQVVFAWFWEVKNAGNHCSSIPFLNVFVIWCKIVLCLCLYCV